MRWKNLLQRFFKEDDLGNIIEKIIGVISIVMMTAWLAATWIVLYCIP